MKIIGRIALAFLGAGLVGLTGGIAQARTPTPTSTATPAATMTPTPTPWPTPTPTLPPEKVAKFSGEAWLDAFGGYDRVGSVTAKVGDTVCGQSFFLCNSSPCIHIPVDPPPEMLPYALDVVPDEVKAGCGYEGAPVTFLVGDKQAKQTAVWHAGTSQEVNLSAGPPFAFFQGSLDFPSGLDPSIGFDAPIGMNAYVGDNLCGQETRGVWKGLLYDIVVKSGEQQPGCGVEGAQITFKLRDGQGNIIGVAREKGVWHAWGDGNVGEELDLTMAPVGSMGINLGSVGTGGSQESGTSACASLSLVLASMGFGGVAVGAALRRRARAS